LGLNSREREAGAWGLAEQVGDRQEKNTGDFQKRFYNERCWGWKPGIGRNLMKKIGHHAKHPYLEAIAGTSSHRSDTLL
jgi:hypothetical protein